MQALQFAVDNQIIPQSAMKETKLESIGGLGRDVNGDWVRKALYYTLESDLRHVLPIYNTTARGKPTPISHTSYTNQLKTFIREMMLKHDL